MPLIKMMVEVPLLRLLKNATASMHKNLTEEIESKLTSLEPLTVRVSAAVKLTGISRSRLYELIQSGDLETVKVGRLTLIPFKSLRALTRT